MEFSGIEDCDFFFYFGAGMLISVLVSYCLTL